MTARREAELYLPIKRMLEERGYEVKAEVNTFDVVAVQGDDVVVVELKASFNLDIVLQGIDRQMVANNVYLAVEMPRNPLRGRNGLRWNDIRRLCQRLGLGLIGVTFTADSATTQVICDAAEVTPRRSKVKRAKLLAEFAQRTGDHNVGGSTRRPIVTAYRERALRIASRLAIHGPGKPSAVKEETGVANSYSILTRNVYGWFVKQDKAVYGVSDTGRGALALYADVVSSLDLTPSLSPRRADAVAIARYLMANGPSGPAAVRAATGIGRAPGLLSSGGFGWFERIARGLYGVTDEGIAALAGYGG